MKLFLTILTGILALMPLYSCSVGINVSEKPKYPIFIWADESEIPSESKLQFREYKPPWHYHPCGVVREIEVVRIPPYGAAEYIKGTERIIEFDEKGKVVGYWAMPVDSWVMAIDGDSIIVRYNFNKQAMSISKDGDISLVEPVNPVSKQVRCPKSIESEFGNSAYDRCVELRDLKTGKLRYLAYEMPCT